MFIVFSKQKIYSYLVALGTVAVLFVVGFTVTGSDTVQTSGNIEKNNIVINQINNEAAGQNTALNQTNNT